MPPSSSGPSDPSPGELLARAGWLAVESALIRGLAHDLNGRATALGGLVELLRLDEDGADPPVLDLLREESTRLGEAVELLRLLAGDSEDEPPEPLALEPLLELVLGLHARHRGLEEVETALEVEADGAVRVRRTFLVRALLLLLGAAGWAAREAGGRRVDVALRRRDDRVVVVIGLPGRGTGEKDAAGTDASAGTQRSGPGIAAAVRGVEAVLERDGAAVDRREGSEGAGACLELSLPALRRHG